MDSPNPTIEEDASNISGNKLPMEADDSDFFLKFEVLESLEKKRTKRHCQSHGRSIVFRMVRQSVGHAVIAPKLDGFI